MTTNPDEGSRIHSRFVRVQDGTPLALDNAPRRWLTDSGQRPTDEWLREQSPAFYGWITMPAPPFNPMTEKLVEVPIPELAPDHTNGTVTQTWRVVALTAEEIAADNENRKLRVNTERNLRIQAGFDWNGTRFDARPEDKTRIAGAAQLAFMYIAGGGDPAAVDWNDPGSGVPFGWIAADNSVVAMTAPQVIDFAKAAARWESLNVFAARALKDAPGGVPDNFDADVNWPNPSTFMS